MPTVCPAIDLDQAMDHFDASTLAVVDIGQGNPATNVIPHNAAPVLNIRFQRHTISGASLTDGTRRSGPGGRCVWRFRIGIKREDFGPTPMGAR